MGDTSSGLFIPEPLMGQLIAISRNMLTLSLPNALIEFINVACNLCRTVQSVLFLPHNYN